MNPDKPNGPGLSLKIIETGSAGTHDLPAINRDEKAIGLFLQHSVFFRQKCQ